MDKPHWGTYVAWAGVAIILVYAILKSVGIIHSPTWQEMAPLFGAAAAFGGLISTVGHLGKDIAEMKVEVKEIKSEVKEVREKVYHLDKDVEVLKDRLGRSI